MSFLLLLILVLVVWLLLPVIKVFWQLHKMRRNPKSFLDNLFGNFGAEGTRPKEERHQQQPKKGPKIPDDVGEYVQFEEVDVKVEESQYVNNDGSTTTRFKVEEQIVDVEWEDLPDKK
ncbi:MAG: hypothetical protein J1F20_01675 [Muribaculaceae bacterium]|nr:hypothetical protein [Muribaculaceae bacterium]